MKITNVKAMVAKMFTLGMLAGAMVFAAPSKAQAQVAVGVHVGPVGVYAGPAFRRPVYVAPAPVVYGPAYYAPGFYGAGFGPRWGWEHRDFYRHDDRRFFHR